MESPRENLSRARFSLCHHPRALPALFFADALAGFAAEVLAELATGARAFLAASDLVAVFFTAAFFAGFGAASVSAACSVFGAAFTALAFLPFALPPPLAARSSIS